MLSPMSTQTKHNKQVRISKKYIPHKNGFQTKIELVMNIFLSERLEELIFCLFQDSLTIEGNRATMC